MDDIIIQGVPVSELLRAYDQKLRRLEHNRANRSVYDAKHREVHREERKAYHRAYYERKKEMLRQQEGYIERGRGRPKKVQVSESQEM